MINIFNSFAKVLEIWYDQIFFEYFVQNNNILFKDPANKLFQKPLNQNIYSMRKT